MGSTARGPQGGRATRKAAAAPGRRPSKAATNRLMALSGAVIVAVYTAGYARTEGAAQRANAALAALKTGAGSALPAAGGSIPASLSAATITSSTASSPAATPSAAAPAAASGSAPAAASSSAPAAASSSPPAAASSAPPAAASSAPPAAAPPPASTSSAPKAVATGYKNGSFTATGWGPHGPIQVTVVIQKGRIHTANITGCGTTYSCQYMQPLTQLVVSQQKAPTEYVSGATASSLAYQQAVVSALAQA